MGDVTDYLDSIDGADRAALERVYAMAREVVPDAVEGTSYALAALLHRGKGLIAAVKAKRFLSLYPYSGRVLATLANELRDFETTSGSIHFSAAHPLPDELLRRIVEARRDEIDAKPADAPTGVTR